MEIIYKGINTNNLKNIDISIPYDSIILFTGPSGSGKSSLAIDTIHKISEDELFQLFSKKEDCSNYSIKHYDNILPSVCLQQENYNRNPRSTIASYFNIDMLFKELFSRKNSVSQRIFQFNNIASACELCRALGSIYSPDILSIVDFSCNIINQPFKIWSGSKFDLFQKLLFAYCKEKNIPTEINFFELDEKEQYLLLNTESENKYKIEFTSQNRKHVRTTKYKGPIVEINEELKKGKVSKNYAKYLTTIVCPKCNGARFNSEVLKYKVFGKNIGELYLLELDELNNWIKQVRSQFIIDDEDSHIFKKIELLITEMIKLNLGYLNLNRSIPSLSGGELQRLRLAKAIASHFSNFLYIFDEPTSSIHPKEWPVIAETIHNLKKKKNTIIIIEHNEYLKKISDCIIYLGPGGGKQGGQIVCKEDIELSNKSIISKIVFKSSEYFLIKNGNCNNICNLTVKLPLHTLIGISGVSGSGKTSFLRNILPKYLDNSQYFSQSPINGNSYSIIATAFGIFDEVQRLFIESTKKPKEYFTFSSKGAGQCPTCCGRGFIIDDSLFIKDKLICPNCLGKRFSNIALKNEYNNLNIYEFLNLTINEILNIIPIHFKKLFKILKDARRVGLGYLSLFQNVDSLSGGEAQRVKFIGNLNKFKSKRFFLLDEPFRGVDNKNISNILEVFYSLIEQDCTILFAEHNPFALSFCSYLLEFGPGSGKSGGKIVAFSENY